MSAANPPGWYPDASLPGQERWWDGGTWSHVTRSAPGSLQTSVWTTPAASAPSPEYSNYPAYPTYPEYQQQYPSGQFGPTTPDGVPLAGVWWRLLARMIDGLITGTISAVIGFSFVRKIFHAIITYADASAAATAAGTPQPADPFAMYRTPGYLSGIAGLTAVQLAVGCVYWVLFIHLGGATPGKLAVGIRVRPWLEDRRPSWGEAFRRWLLTDVAGIISIYGLLDELWLFWDSRRQCLHDKWPKTVVTRRR